MITDGDIIDAVNDIEREAAKVGRGWGDLSFYRERLYHDIQQSIKREGFEVNVLDDLYKVYDAIRKLPHPFNKIVESRKET